MYHVVCHDCTFEELRKRLSAAKLDTRSHTRATNHNTEYAQVD
jgi:hypothetical protein